MEKTKFRKLALQIEALCPMCQFDVAEILCTAKELFFRNRYCYLNEELDRLVNGGHV